MRPWTIDADDIHIATDYDDGVLHKTSWIQNFLDAGRDDKFIVVGPKGFGKTLLLKAKRIRYQQSGQQCIPQHALLDKPVGDKVFSRRLLSLYEDIDPWNKVWLTAIASAVLKQTGLPDQLDVSPRFSNLLRNTQLRSVLDHFVVLLDFAPRDVHRCAQETNSLLVPLLRTLNTPVGVFIDSVDEYFNKHIHAPIWRASFSGELSPNVWFLSQMSLVEVAYQLRRVTKHLKVFATVRKEAFDRLAETSPMVQQYRGSAIETIYTESGLRQIFINNILRERRSNLSMPERLDSSPIEAFVGRRSTVHGFTGVEEEVFGYIERHTLRRPRDLMSVGQKLTSLEPEERRIESRFKRAVNDAAKEVAQEYLNEIAPHIGDVDLSGLLTLISNNVLSAEALDVLSDQYDQAPEHHGNATGREAFAALYQVGLLGIVVADAISGRRMQRFLGPGESRFGTARTLPPSSHYVLHSVLSEHIAAINPRYADEVDRSNIIGHGLEWRDPIPAIRSARVPSYRGDDPFVYVSYSHDDAAIVHAEVAWLTERGIKVWYDEGIPAGSRWSDELAAAIRRAPALLIFISANSVQSNHCINEVNFAYDLGNTVLAVHIQETVLPDGLKLMLGSTQTIRRHMLETAVYRRQLLEALERAAQGRG